MLIINLPAVGRTIRLPTAGRLIILIIAKAILQRSYMLSPIFRQFSSYIDQLD